MFTAENVVAFHVGRRVDEDQRLDWTVIRLDRPLRIDIGDPETKDEFIDTVNRVLDQSWCGYFYNGPGRDFSHGVSVRLNRGGSKILLTQTVALDI